MKKKGKKKKNNPDESTPLLPVVCMDWMGMGGDRIVTYIHGLPYTERALLNREKRLPAEELEPFEEQTDRDSLS